MIADIIGLVLKNFPFTALILGIVAALVSIAIRKPSTGREVADRLVAGYLFFAIGLGYAYNFVVHSFFAESTAKFIGWANSPFQYEVAYASLGFAIAGFYSYRKSFQARMVAILGPSFFLWGAAAGHIYFIITTENTAPGNAGSVLYSDIILPIIGFVFLFFSRERDQKPGKAQP